jgi:hypothetical protein
VARRRIEAPRTFVIITRAKIDARERVKCKFVKGGGSDIGKA